MSDKRLGERVKAARLAQGMTMVELATICGLTKGFISQMESGTSNPSLNTLRKIGNALKVPVSDLLDKADVSSLVEQVPPETPRPTILHEASGLAGQPGIFTLSSGPDGVHSLATVPAGSRLTHVGTMGEDETHGTAIVTVLAGRISLVQDHEGLELSRGGVASWDAGAGYTIEATGIADASLILFTPQGCALPAYQTTRAASKPARALHPVSPIPVHSGVAPDRRRGIPVSIQGRLSDSGEMGKAEGPLRLVAMRAQRLAARRGQS